MTATVSGYAWWSTRRPAWAVGHCVTLLSDITTEGVISSLRAGVVRSVRGIDGLSELIAENWNTGNAPAWAMIGVTQVDRNRALMVELNGFVGVTERLIGPMSPGRTIVSHYSIDVVHSFNWWCDGMLLVDFDLSLPGQRFGTDPAALDDHLHEVGLPLDGDPDDIAGIDLSAAGFALAERITNVRCTPELFEGSDFMCAYVPIRGGEEQQQYNDALRAPWHHRATW